MPGRLLLILSSLCGRLLLGWIVVLLVLSWPLSSGGDFDSGLVGLSISYALKVTIYLISAVYSCNICSVGNSVIKIGLSE